MTDAGSVFTPGTRVRTIRKAALVEAGRCGEVAAVNADLRWSIEVRFDGWGYNFPCRPDELEPLS